MDWAIDVAKARGSGINSWGARHNRHVSDLASGHFNFRMSGGAILHPKIVQPLFSS